MEGGSYGIRAGYIHISYTIVNIYMEVCSYGIVGYISYTIVNIHHNNVKCITSRIGYLHTIHYTELTKTIHAVCMRVKLRQSKRINQFCLKRSKRTKNRSLAKHIIYLIVLFLSRPRYFSNVEDEGRLDSNPSSSIFSNFMFFGSI